MGRGIGLMAALVFVFQFVGFTQNYYEIPIKEEFNLFNRIYGDNKNYCGLNISWNSSDSVAKYSARYGDGLSKTLQGYLELHALTGDDAYLYKFMLEAMCMMEHRADYHNSYLHPDFPNTPRRWSSDNSTYQDGYIIGSFAKFCHYIKMVSPGYYNKPLYPFTELNGGNNFSQSFSTFGDYADWLAQRTVESLSFFQNGGYWDNSLGFKRKPSDNNAMAVNQQVGFAQCLLFIGLYNNNQQMLMDAKVISDKFNSVLYLNDYCANQFFQNPVVLTNATTNSHYWYHAGWKVSKYCSNTSDDVSSYIENLEDISHGSETVRIPLDFYDYHPNPSFSLAHMVKYRNMFSEEIYDGNGGFFNSVRGTDGPVYYKIGNQEFYGGTPSHNFFRRSNIAYIRLEEFDVAAGTGTDVYDIVMDYYGSDVTFYPSLANALPPITGSYSTQMMRGHAELTKAQWEHECMDLKLFNRDVVYNQDFWADNMLTIQPRAYDGVSCGSNYDCEKSFADPIITDLKFTIEPGVRTEMYAGKKVRLEAGFQVRSGGEFKAYVDPEMACVQGTPPAGPNEAPNPVDEHTPVSNRDNILDQYYSAAIKDESQSNIYLDDWQVLIYPNPTNGQLNFNSNRPSNLQVEFWNVTGANVLQFEINNQNSTKDVSELPKGLYLVKITSNEGAMTRRILIE